MTLSARVAIGAGGTAGHVVPALLAGRALVDRGLSHDDIVFLGGRGVETTMVPAAGFRLVSLPVRRARRPLWHPANAVAGAVMVVSLFRAVGLLRRRGVRSVLSLGGFAALPVALAAALTRRRLVLLEPNARPGLANRVCGRLAAAVAVPFEAFGVPFGARAVTVGLLVRPEMWSAVDSSAARRALGLPDGRVVVGIVGGSQGARRLNLSLLGCYDAWRHRPDLAILHVAGPTQIDDVAKRLADLQAEGDKLLWKAVAYQEDMPLFYGACDLVVCRAGYSTLAEILATGTPAVMVPGAFAEGHQEANAEVAAGAGAAVVVGDGEATSARLRRVIEELVDDPARRQAMAKAGRAVAGEPGEAGARLAELILEGVA